MALQTEVFQRHTSNWGLWELSTVSMYWGPFLHNKHKEVTNTLLHYYCWFVHDNTAFCCISMFLLWPSNRLIYFGKTICTIVTRVGSNTLKYHTLLYYYYITVTISSNTLSSKFSTSTRAPPEKISPEEECEQKCWNGCWFRIYSF